MEVGSRFKLHFLRFAHTLSVLRTLNFIWGQGHVPRLIKTCLLPGMLIEGWLEIAMEVSSHNKVKPLFHNLKHQGLLSPRWSLGTFLALHLLLIVDTKMAFSMRRIICWTHMTIFAVRKIKKIFKPPDSSFAMIDFLPRGFWWSSYCKIGSSISSKVHKYFESKILLQGKSLAQVAEQSAHPAHS